MDNSVKYQIWLKAKFGRLYVGTIYRISDRQQWDFLKSERWYLNVMLRTRGIKLYHLKKVKRYKIMVQQI